MVHKLELRVPTWAVASVLLAGTLSLSDTAQVADLRSPFNLAHDVRVQGFAKLIQKIDENASQATTEIELAAIDTKIGEYRQTLMGQFKDRMGTALREWTALQSAITNNEQRGKALDAAIEAEAARISAPPATAEEGALDGVIAQVKAELAGLEARQQRVPAIESRLQAMPRSGFMDSAPREHLEAELAEARTNLPKPDEIPKARAELARYEAELASKRATRPGPNQGDLARLKQQRSAIEEVLRVDILRAAEEKKNFIRSRAQALGLVELMDWLDGIVVGRRQALAGATGIPRAFAHCATMQGPFKCTGAFDGTWSRRCGANDNANGIAKVTFGPDGWVEVRMTNANPQSGEPPTIVGGRISADGSLVIERNTQGESEIYRGQFNLVTSTLASGAAKPIGSGTYQYVLKAPNGQETMRCSGSMKLS